MQRFAPFILTLTVLFSSQSARAARALGIDVYHGDGTINWTSVKNAGYSFAFAKSTEGLTFTDSQFATNMTTAKNTGILIGAYHYSHPETNTALAEATKFYNTVQPYLTTSY